MEIIDNFLISFPVVSWFMISALLFMAAGIFFLALQDLIAYIQQLQKYIFIIGIGGIGLWILTTVGIILK